MLGIVLTTRWACPLSAHMRNIRNTERLQKNEGRSDPRMRWASRNNGRAFFRAGVHRVDSCAVDCALGVAAGQDQHGSCVVFRSASRLSRLGVVRDRFRSRNCGEPLVGGASEGPARTVRLRDRRDGAPACDARRIFSWVQPANAVTENWTVMPENWSDWRRQWEHGHAMIAVVTFAAFCCTALAVSFVRR